VPFRFAAQPETTAGATFARVTGGEASISSNILARYAADAAGEVDGVRGLAGRRGVRVEGEDGEVHIELHLELDWGASIPEVGRRVQHRVGEYLARMADVELAVVDVIVDEVGPAS
jgi:uncharacterized alkaline shock family protein YloU